MLDGSHTLPLPPAWSWATALAPLLVGFVFSRAAGLPAGAARRATAAGGGLALAGAVVAAGVAAAAAFTSPAAANGLGLARAGGGTYVDGLTLVLLLTVTLIGAAVTRYQVRYLDGDPEQARFSQWLAFTLSAVLVLVVAGHLLLFFAAWLATSYGLHHLLTHCANRPAAVRAARAKFVTSRLGDVFLLGAFALVYGAFDSLSLAEILPRAGDPAAAGAAATPIALLLVLAAMAKSAQLPFHGWLPDAMETPTPVSALMHAGIINAGGFLLIRTSPLLVSAPGVLTLLAIWGALTALFGSIVMLTQTDIKRKYAWSTVSQMGFMMLQCGLGAFAAATLHLVGHAFYKGHAFLSSGSAVDPDDAGAAARVGRPRPPALATAAAVAAGVAVVVAALLALGIDPARKPGLVVLGSVLALAIAQILLASRTAIAGPRRAARIGLAIGGGIAVAYFAVLGAFERLLAGVVPAASFAAGSGEALASVVLVALFLGAAAWPTAALAGRGGPWIRAAWVHAHNGFYVGALQTGLVQRLWPERRSGRAQGGTESCA